MKHHTLGGYILVDFRHRILDLQEFVLAEFRLILEFFQRLEEDDHSRTEREETKII